MNKKMINIEKDFTWAPAGRYRKHGDYTGQVFRESLLVPALKESNNVTVDLDGVIGYGSSFIEEAFGGLVRVHGYSQEQLKKRLHIKTVEFPSIKQEIWSYISDAEEVSLIS